MSAQNLIIVIDNPNRDLLPWIATISEIKGTFQSIRLISMNVLYRNYRNILKSLDRRCHIVFNYARATNEKIIYYFKLYGHVVTIYDTEGSPYSTDKFAKNLRCQNVIDNYLCWGERVYSCLRNSQIDRRKLFLVGSIRHLLLPKYLPQAKQKNSILICSKSCLAFPRYNTPGKELTTLISSFNFTLEECLDLIATNIYSRYQVIELCKKIKATYPHLDVVLRLHPFERLDACHLEEVVSAGVKISENNDFFVDAMKAIAVIGSSCTTSADCYYLECDYIDCSSLYPSDDNFNRHLATYQCNSLSDVVDIINVSIDSMENTNITRKHINSRSRIVCVNHNDSEPLFISHYGLKDSLLPSMSQVLSRQPNANILVVTFLCIVNLIRLETRSLSFRLLALVGIKNNFSLSQSPPKKDKLLTLNIISDAIKFLGLQSSLSASSSSLYYFFKIS